MADPNPNLPHEIIVDILSRLPVKSLCRFRCVSQPWRTSISDPHFVKLQLNRNHHNQRIILLSDSLYSVDHEALLDGNDAEAVRLKFPPKRNPNCCEEILGSCNGLLLLVTDEDSHFLVNPSTRESKKLPNSPFTIQSLYSYNLYGLGYDSHNDDYKVVRICYCNEESDCADNNIVSVYSIRTNYWRRIRDSPYDHSQCEGESPPGILVNGALHWLASRDTGSDYLSAIASFNLVDEKFRDVMPPGSVDHVILCQLGVLGGCLSVIVCRTFVVYDVWVMKEYGIGESWTKFTINVPNMSFLKPLCLSRNGEVLLEMDGVKLVLFNTEEKTSKDLVVCGIPTFDEAGMYVESLVSPNHSNRIKRQRREPRNGSWMDVMDRIYKDAAQLLSPRKVLCKQFFIPLLRLKVRPKFFFLDKGNNVILYSFTGDEADEARTSIYGRWDGPYATGPSLGLKGPTIFEAWT